jgi:hypothetical protein
MPDFILVVGPDVTYKGKKTTFCIHKNAVSKIYPAWVVEAKGKWWACTSDYPGATIYFELHTFNGDKINCGPEDLKMFLTEEQIKIISGQEPDKRRIGFDVNDGPPPKP